MCLFITFGGIFCQIPHFIVPLCAHFAKETSTHARFRSLTRTHPIFPAGRTGQRQPPGGQGHEGRHEGHCHHRPRQHVRQPSWKKFRKGTNNPRRSWRLAERKSPRRKRSCSSPSSAARCTWPTAPWTRRKAGKTKAAGTSLSWPRTRKATTTSSSWCPARGPSASICAPAPTATTWRSTTRASSSAPPAWAARCPRKSWPTAWTRRKKPSNGTRTSSARTTTWSCNATRPPCPAPTMRPIPCNRR